MTDLQVLYPQNIWVTSSIQICICCVFILSKMQNIYDFTQLLLYFISVMRSNRGVAVLPKSKQKMLLTADVSNVLQALNGNTFWKNCTNKIHPSKSIKGAGTVSKNNKNNQMTQQEIDKLFESKQKNKIKTEFVREESPAPHRHFHYQIKFLQMEDSYDRLIAGLKINDSSRLIADNFEAQNKENKQTDLTQQFKQKFLVGKVIGEGAYASVRVAISKNTNRKVAIKVYEKNKIKESQRKKSVRREILILQQLSHDNIVKIYDVVQTNNHLNIIMEYLGGISLNSFLKNQTNNRISENKCRKIMKGLASALSYMHSLCIAHRDLKLENVIIDDNLKPKLIDFGFSTCLGRDKKVKIFCGTPSYMAPEIVQKKQYIGQKADIWALGVLFYVCITGIFPFKGSTDQQLYNKINRADYCKSELAFSKQISDLINRMLKINPEQRITATQILQHPWLKNQNSHLNTQTSHSKNKRCIQSSQNEYKKRVTTISSHKSKQSWTNKQILRLTETYKENLKLELRLAKQSPKVSYNNTCTNKKSERNNNQSRTFIRGDKQKSKLDNSEIMSTKGQNLRKQKKKSEARVLELFKNELKMKEDKQKSKSKKKYF